MYHKTILKNGIRFITIPIASSKTATIMVLVGAGSKCEKKETNGISHFLEHMFFKGTAARPDALAVSETLDRVGGAYNAFTGKEYTGFWAKVSPEHLDLAMDWLSDIILHSKFESAEIEKEKGGDTTKKNVINIGITEIKAQEFAHYIEVQGKVDGDENVGVNAKTMGVVTKIFVSVGDEVKNRLREIAKKEDWKVVVAPREANDAQIALVAWGRVLKMDEPDYAKIEDFIKVYRNRGPEKTPE